MTASLVEQLAIPLSNQNTVAKWLVIAPALWVRHLAIRLSCQPPQLSRWLSRERGERSEGGEPGLCLIELPATRLSPAKTLGKSLIKQLAISLRQQAAK